MPAFRMMSSTDRPAALSRSEARLAQIASIVCTTAIAPSRDRPQAIRGSWFNVENSRANAPRGTCYQENGRLYQRQFLGRQPSFPPVQDNSFRFGDCAFKAVPREQG